MRVIFLTFIKKLQLLQSLFAKLDVIIKTPGSRRGRYDGQVWNTVGSEFKDKTLF